MNISKKIKLYAVKTVSMLATKPNCFAVQVALTLLASVAFGTLHTLYDVQAFFVTTLFILVLDFVYLFRAIDLDGLKRAADDYTLAITKK